jgi:hypothetical protein
MRGSIFGGVCSFAAMIAPNLFIDPKPVWANLATTRLQ